MNGSQSGPLFEADGHGCVIQSHWVDNVSQLTSLDLSMVELGVTSGGNDLRVVALPFEKSLQLNVGPLLVVLDTQYVITAL